MSYNQSSQFIGFNDTLFQFSKNPENCWTLQDALRGTQIFGGIGSGKTSGSGRLIAKAFLKKGFGGLVLCAKPDERSNWEKLALQAGRSSDLVIFEENSDHYFNPLSYETTREGKGAGESYNLVNLFMNIYQMGRAFSGEGMSKEGDRFWDNALKRCLSRMIDLLKIAKEEVSILNMQKLITSALSKEEIEHLIKLRTLPDKEKAYSEITNWAKENYYIHCFLNAWRNSTKPDIIDQTEAQYVFHMARNYFEREFGNLAEKTRMIIVESFLGIAEPFLGGILKKHFAGKTNIHPECTFHEGKIIIMDFPIKNYLDAGVYAQGIFKLLFQQAMERRDFKQGKDRPVFLWVDESQFFLSDYDQTFQTTARSSGTCTVFLSQNISNYYAAMGGRNPKPKVDSLLANLSTKIFHANNDAVTNEWAANVIGKKFKKMKTVNLSVEDSASVSEQLHYQIEPAVFSELKTGGENEDPKWNLKVEGVLTVTGKIWSNGKNYIRLPISQI